MKDLTVFHTTYRELLQQGRTWAESFCEATEAQDLFDKYIAEQIEASKLQPVDAKTAMQDFTEAISLNPDTAGKCNGNCGMIYCDVNGCIESKKNLVEDVPCEPEQDQESKDRVRLQQIKEQVRQHFLTVKIEQSFTVKPNLTK